MITLKRITTEDKALYAFMENLMTTSFPTDEYRELDELRTFTDTRPQFVNNVIFDDDTPIGFISYWNFEDFHYAEHFAIDTSQRNGGYGKKVLQLLCESLHRPIILEVELPDTEMAQRRINFYRRNGFALWDNDYLQPPYKKGASFIPMRLMAYGPLDSVNDFERIKNCIYRNVYGTES